MYTTESNWELLPNMGPRHTWGGVGGGEMQFINTNLKMEKYDNKVIRQIYHMEKFTFLKIKIHAAELSE